MDDTKMYVLRVAIAMDQKSRTVSKPTLEFWQNLRDSARENYVEAIDQEAKS